MEALKVMIKRAVKAKACDSELNKLKRFKDLDDLIENATDQQKAEWAYWYTRYIVKDRWPEVEPFVIKNSDSAYLYAKNIIEGRWVEAEPIIMKNTKCIYLYAKNIIKDRWYEAEEHVRKDPHWGNLYRMVYGEY